MRATFVYLGATLALAAGAARAQVGGPLLGYLPSGGHLLPVNGIAASASVASALDFGEQFLQMAVSPRQNFAVASALDSGSVMIAYPAGTTTAIAGTAAFPSSITLSPSGSAAVLWFASSRSLEIISGLPSAPAVRTVEASFLSGPFRDLPYALSVSDDGAWGAGAWPSGVWAFGPNGEVRSLMAGERAYALAFFPGQENLLAATRAGIASIAAVGGSAAVSTLYTSNGQTPAGLAVTADSSKIVLADEGGNITAIDASTGAGVAVACGCAPDEVVPMGAALFRITNLTGSVFRVFDARGGSVFQVPLSAGAQGAAGSGVSSGGRLSGALGTGGAR